jgi:NAD(P)-dependent dehydrogenase (short-subunit alcohol dehydrogenase family)
MPRLENKIAVVTGGAHGIGKAIGELFAHEGATVFIADIDEKAGQIVASEICKKGRAAMFVNADVASAEQVSRAVKIAGQRNGRIDILCNNAAYLTQWHDSGEATEEEWQKCFAVSLMGAQHFTREVLPFMVRQKQGSIINISSIQGLVGGRNSAAYTSIKSALLGFTRSVACDFGQHNVRVNAICPGAIQTRISPRAGEELYERQVSKTLLGRVGQAGEVAYAALFFASDESSYITGAVLPVDGGWTAI